MVLLQLEHQQFGRLPRQNTNR